MSQQALSVVQPPLKMEVLYAIRLGPGLYKIGRSGKQQGRVKSGQTFFNKPLLTVCSVPVANASEAETQCLHLLGSRGRQAGHEVVERTEEEVIQAIHLVSGKKPLRPHQIGRRLWEAEYKGRTVGEWAADVWDAKEARMRTGSFAMTDRRSKEVLRELGMGAFCVEYRYLHFYEINKLIKALPELGLWATTLRGWEGILPGGDPLLNDEEEKRTAVKLSVVKD